MSKKKIKNSFLLQGSILAVAGLLVRVIGLIYRVPLTNILGEKGMGCYGTAYDVYNILILLFFNMRHLLKQSIFLNIAPVFRLE